MCVCVYVCTQTSMHTSMCVYICVCACVHATVCVHVHDVACTCVFVCSYNSWTQHQHFYYTVCLNDPIIYEYCNRIVGRGRTNPVPHN